MASSAQVEWNRRQLEEIRRRNDPNGRIRSSNTNSKSFDSDYDHRWDDHPSWYTDNKKEQRKMVRKSIEKRKRDWD